MCSNCSLIFLRPRLWLQTLSVTVGNPWTSLVLNFLICTEAPQTLNLAYLPQRAIMRLKWENTELAFKQIVGWKRVELTGKSSQTMSSWKVRLGKFKCSVLSTTRCRSTRAGIAQAAWELLSAVTLKEEQSVHQLGYFFRCVLIVLINSKVDFSTPASIATFKCQNKSCHNYQQSFSLPAA